MEIDSIPAPVSLAAKCIAISSEDAEAWVRECQRLGAAEAFTAGDRTRRSELAILDAATRSPWEWRDALASCEEAVVVRLPTGQAGETMEWLAAAGWVDMDLFSSRERAGCAIWVRKNGRPKDSLPPLYRMHYDEDLSPERILIAHREWGRRYDPPPPRPARAGTGERIRIGFVSQDFRGNHPVLFFLRPLLRHLDRSRMEVTLYSSTNAPDESTRRLGELATLRNIAPLSDAGAAEWVRMDRMDVLVDLCGHLRNTRLAIFAHRPAPLQLSWLAYPNTSGLAAIDYRISDAVSDPETRPAEWDAIDPVLRLPGCFVTYSPQDDPSPSALPALLQPYVTFGVFNNPSKITNAAMDAWARILFRTPQSRLLFHHGISTYHLQDGADQRRIARGLEERGLTPDRYRFVGGLHPFRANLEVYGEADIALDTFPYNGTTTTCESLWMGLPVIHCEGRSHVARVTTTLLHHAGLARWSCGSVDEYVERAVEAASDLDALASYRASARAMLRASRLFDHSSFAHDFEAAVRRALRDHC